MNVDQLFPPCNRADCPDKTKGHRHIMPKQKELLESNEKFIALVGGYGSGKTLPTCVLGHLLSVAVPGNIGIVLRRSLPKLHDSTERIFLEVLERSGVGYKARELRDGWPHRIIYSNGSEVYFRETKDLGRFLGPEYGWFYIDEAQEEPEKTFKDLVGRLRLPRASKYLRGLLSTNPPSKTHWIAKLFPEPGTFSKTMKLRNGKKVTTSYRMIQSSTYDNPFLSSEYIADIVANNSPAEARRIIEGFYGFAQDGKAVYPMFDFFKHVGEPKPYMATIYRVWDFGFRCPAVCWSQIFHCKQRNLHMNVLHELVPQEIESEELARIVLKETSDVFQGHPVHLIMDGGDTAGAQVNEKGPGPIIRLAKPRAEGGFGLNFRHRKFPDIDPGLDLIRRLLRTKCPCGYYLITIHRRCQALIEAMAGGYHMVLERPGREPKNKPVKDGYYDNICDALRYSVELFYRPMSNGMELDGAYTGSDVWVPNEEQHPWSWMGG